MCSDAKVYFGRRKMACANLSRAMMPAMVRALSDYDERHLPRCFRPIPRFDTTLRNRRRDSLSRRDAGRLNEPADVGITGCRDRGAGHFTSATTATAVYDASPIEGRRGVCHVSSSFIFSFCSSAQLIKRPPIISFQFLHSSTPMLVSRPAAACFFTGEPPRPRRRQGLPPLPILCWLSPAPHCSRLPRRSSFL